MKPSVLLLTAMLAATPTIASAQGNCSRETLNVLGTPVTIGYCVDSATSSAPGETALAVSGTYASSSGSFKRTSTMKFITGEGPSKVLESVDLQPLGLTGTLHLTLLYSGGSVHIANAMLTPGAVIVK